MNLMLIVAQVAQVAEAHPALYTYGPLGIICAWLMWRDERRAIEQRTMAERVSGDYRSLGHRIVGLSKVMLVDITERDSCGIHVKKYARDEIAKIEARLTAKQ